MQNFIHNYFLNGIGMQIMTLILMKLFLGYGKHIWWNCSVCGNKWKATGIMRTRRNSTGCPVCARKKQAKSRQKTFLQSGVKTLNQTNPELVVEWNYEKNGDLNPEFITVVLGKVFGGNVKIVDMNGRQK